MSKFELFTSYIGSGIEFIGYGSIDGSPDRAPDKKRGLVGIKVLMPGSYVKETVEYRVSSVLKLRKIILNEIDARNPLADGRAAAFLDRIDSTRWSVVYYYYPGEILGDRQKILLIAPFERLVRGIGGCSNFLYRGVIWRDRSPARNGADLVAHPAHDLGNEEIGRLSDSLVNASLNRFILSAGFFWAVRSILPGRRLKPRLRLQLSVRWLLLFLSCLCLTDFLIVKSVRLPPPSDQYIVAEEAYLNLKRQIEKERGVQDALMQQISLRNHPADVAEVLISVYEANPDVTLNKLSIVGNDVRISGKAPEINGFVDMLSTTPNVTRLSFTSPAKIAKDGDTEFDLAFYWSVQRDVK